MLDCSRVICDNVLADVVSLALVDTTPELVTEACKCVVEKLGSVVSPSADVSVGDELSKDIVVLKSAVLVSVSWFADVVFVVPVVKSGMLAIDSVQTSMCLE